MKNIYNSQWGLYEIWSRIRCLYTCNFMIYFLDFKSWIYWKFRKSSIEIFATVLSFFVEARKLNLVQKLFLFSLANTRFLYLIKKYIQPLEKCKNIIILTLYSRIRLRKLFDPIVYFTVGLLSQIPLGFSHLILTILGINKMKRIWIKSITVHIKNRLTTLGGGGSSRTPIAERSSSTLADITSVLLTGLIDTLIFRFEVSSSIRK